MLPNIERTLDSKVQAGMEARTKQAAEQAAKEEQAAELRQQVLDSGGVSLADIDISEEMLRKGLVAEDMLIPDPENEGKWKPVRFGSVEPEGVVVTQAMLIENSNLSEAGLEVGDQLVDKGDGTYKPMYIGANKSYENFKYFFKETDWITDRVQDYVWATAPKVAETASVATSLIGKVFPAVQFLQDSMDINEVREYGEDFVELSPEQRRERIAGAKVKELQEQFPDLIPDKDTGSAVLGGMAKSVADPVMSAVPMARGGKLAAAAVGIGATESGTKQLQKTGAVDVGKLVEETIVTASMIGAGVTGLRAAGTGVKNLPAVAKAVSRAVTPNRVSNRNVKRLGVTINNKKLAGKTDEEAFGEAIEELGIPKKDAIGYVMKEEFGFVPAQSKVGKMVDKFNGLLSRDGQRLKAFSDNTEYLLGLVSTGIKNISPKLHGKMLQFEQRSMKEVQDRLLKLAPSIEQLNKLTKEELETFNWVSQNNPEAAKSFLIDRDIPFSVYEDIRANLDDMYNRLAESGFQINRQDDYIPRVVSDMEGLMGAMGKDYKSKIDKALNLYAKFTNRIIDDGKGGKLPDVSKIPEAERANIINLILSGQDIRLISGKNSKELATMYKMSETGGGIGFFKSRTIDKIPRELMQFYASPIEAIESYITNSVNKIHKDRFFGRQSEDVTEEVMKAKVPRMEIEADLDDVGGLVSRLIDSKQMDANNADKAIALLQARFGKGEVAAPSALRVIRDIGYLGTIANPMSALTNVVDTAFAAYEGGIKNAMLSLFGNKQVKMIDLGIENASQEFQDSSRLVKFMGRAFKASGFSLTDRLGKETIINSALLKYKGMVKSGAGIAKVRGEYVSAFGEEGADVLIDSLKNGVVTQPVKDLLFMRLSKYQPISKLEASAAYMNNPNWRIAYMLKSFTLKQWDLVRNDAYNKIKSGNAKEGYANLAKLSMYLAFAGGNVDMAKDFIRGKDINPEDIPEKFLWQLLSPFGFSKYSSSKYLANGDVAGFITNQIVPATPLFSAVTEGVVATGSAALDPDKEVEYNKLVRPLPVFGDLTYNWFLGGAEKYNEEQEKKRRKAERE